MSKKIQTPAGLARWAATQVLIERADDSFEMRKRLFERFLNKADQLEAEETKEANHTKMIIDLVRAHVASGDREGCNVSWHEFERALRLYDENV